MNIEVDQAQQKFSELIEKTISGDEIIITKEGFPVAKITPLPARTKKRQFGTAKGLIKMATDFDEPLDDFKAYM